MKSVLTICAAVMIVFAAQAQKKPNINKAKTLWEQGKLDEAKAMIDDATTYEKTKDDGKTWYYRGLIYATLDTTSNEAYAALSDNALETALESFKKADELDPSGSKYFTYGAGGLPTTKDQQISGYYGYYFGLAVEAYEQEDLSSASDLFATAWKIMPTDTASIANAGYAAQGAEEYGKAIGYFEKSIELGAKGAGTFYNLINLYRAEKDVEGAMNTIKRAQELYPEDNSLKRLEISMLMEQGKGEQAMAELKEQIETEPNDPALRFAMALLYEEMDSVDMALQAYEGAIGVDPNHYESNYNRAVILFNRGNALYKEKGLLGYSPADQKKAKALDPKIKENFLKAVPAWEKVYELNPKERPALETLLFLYAYLGEEKKADKIEAELIALGEEEEN